MEAKELNEKVENAIAINKDLENQYDSSITKQKELHDRIRSLIQLIYTYKDTREKEIKDFQQLEDESKTTKVELERLNHEIADKEDQLSDEKKKLEDNKAELAELKTHNDKFE